MGQFDTLYFLRDFGSWESERFSSIVRAPAVGSEMDHSFSVSNLSLVLHLHHMQAYSLEAASILVTFVPRIAEHQFYEVWAKCSKVY